MAAGGGRRAIARARKEDGRVEDEHELERDVEHGRKLEKERGRQGGGGWGRRDASGHPGLTLARPPPSTIAFRVNANCKHQWGWWRTLVKGFGLVYFRFSISYGLVE